MSAIISVKRNGRTEILPVEQATDAERVEVLKDVDNAIVLFYLNRVCRELVKYQSVYERMEKMVR